MCSKKPTQLTFVSSSLAGVCTGMAGMVTWMVEQLCSDERGVAGGLIGIGTMTGSGGVIMGPGSCRIDPIEDN